VEGIPKLQIACNTPIQDGMIVHTANDRVKNAREGVMELLLVNHPLDCPICDQAGECKLQDYAYDYGAKASRTKEPRRALKKREELGPTIIFDQERCILCRRCVRFCREVPKTGELSVMNRGDHSVIEAFPGTALDNNYSMNVADICPVGALTTKDFRFKVRVWFLEDVPGICTGCSNGCNVYLGVANNKVYRYQPRRNDAVNETWICDAGRMSYQDIGAPHRLKQCSVRNEAGRLETANLNEAVEEAAGRLRGLVESKGAGVIAGLASAHATNEELFVFRRFLTALGSEKVGVSAVQGDSDDLLIKAEKAPNGTGARELGYGDGQSVVDRITSGGVEALIVMGRDAFIGNWEVLRDLHTVIVLDTHTSELQRVAHVMVPGRHVAEKRGTVVNVQRRVQKIVPAVEPAWEAYSYGEVIAPLGAALELDGFDGRFDVLETGRELSAATYSFAGIDLDSVGDGGSPLAAADEAER
jgi:NADH-quinone oxidoreductase subunit G